MAPNRGIEGQATKGVAAKTTRPRFVLIYVFGFAFVFFNSYSTYQLSTNCNNKDTNEKNVSSLLLDYVGTEGGTEVDQRYERPDGVINNVNVYFRDKSIESHVQCVGENFREDSWQYRSCKFTNLCFDVQKKEYFLFQSKSEKKLETRMEMDIFKTTHTSAVSMKGLNVALGAINLKWRSDVNKIKWFPTVVDEPHQGGYYELPANYVFLPYHSLNAMNPGHLVWDDFLPIYNLLVMFQLKDKRPFLVRHILNPPLWATCDTKKERKEKCAKIIPKFLPLMSVSPTTFRTTGETFLNVTNTDENKERNSTLVCSKYGAAGIGVLSDHGTKKIHGWAVSDYDIVHNGGRGALMYDFRNFMMENIGLNARSTVNLSAPLKITFSTYSSQGRGQSFQQEIDALKSYFREEEIEINALKMETLTLEEQVKLASESSIFVTASGGGSVTGIFLPPGSSLFVYYDDVGGLEGGRKTGTPAMLDFDLLNNLSYIRVHWLPLFRGRSHHRTSPNVTSAFIHLVEHELKLVREHNSNNN